MNVGRGYVMKVGRGYVITRVGIELLGQLKIHIILCGIVNNNAKIVVFGFDQNWRKQMSKKNVLIC